MLAAREKMLWNRSIAYDTIRFPVRPLENGVCILCLKEISPFPIKENAPTFDIHITSFFTAELF